MKPLTSCCCFDLRTGGLILGWLGIIGCVLNILHVLLVVSKVDHLPSETVTLIGVQILILVVVLVLEVFWVVGINKNKEGMMMPSLALSIVGCVIMVIAVAFAVVMCFVAIIAVLSSSNQNQSEKNDVGIVITIALVTVVIYSLLAVLFTYLTAVKYYLYKEIKERNQRLPPNNLIPAGENGMVYKFSA